MKVLGIDSSTKTGLCCLDGDDHRVKLLEVEDVTGYERLQLIAANFSKIVEAWKPDVAFIENYALGLQKNGATVITQIEIGTVTRGVLAYHEVPWRLIRPNTVKLWVGGKGNGGMNKDGMAKFVQSRWGFKHPSNDVVDAYAIARMGQWLMSVDVSVYPKGVDYGHGSLVVECR